MPPAIGQRGHRAYALGNNSSGFPDQAKLMQFLQAFLDERQGFARRPRRDVVELDRMTRSREYHRPRPPDQPRTYDCDFLHFLLTLKANKVLHRRVLDTLAKRGVSP